MLSFTFIWAVFVFQLKTLLLGNSTWTLIRKTPETTLKKSMEKIEVGDLDDEGSEENTFLVNFTKSILGNFILLIVEIILAGYLLYENSSSLAYNLAFAILYKDLILFAIFATWNSKNKEVSLFESLSLTPSWASLLDRISAFISAVCFGTILWYRFHS